jgi:hypothetical protein
MKTVQNAAQSCLLPIEHSPTRCYRFAELEKGKRLTPFGGTSLPRFSRKSRSVPSTNQEMLLPSLFAKATIAAFSRVSMQMFHLERLRDSGSFMRTKTDVRAEPDGVFSERFPPLASIA